MYDTSSKPRRTPVWQSIASELRSDISEGRYGVGDKLQTEAALAVRFGVNRHTVRHALTQLVSEGLVHTRRGAGAFVAARPTDYAIGKRVRFHENLRAVGREPAKKILTLERRAPTKPEATTLAINSETQVLICYGLSLADNVPVAIFEALYPLERLQGIEEALREGLGVTAALKSIGVDDYSRTSTRIDAVLAAATQALHLQIHEGSPLLRISSLSVDGDGNPVELGRTWFAGDRVTLTFDD
ncbi:phosphonate metabolism transcriptional regulator PhnF [Yoonia sp. MH D7]